MCAQEPDIRYVVFKLEAENAGLYIFVDGQKVEPGLDKLILGKFYRMTTWTSQQVGIANGAQSLPVASLRVALQYTFDLRF
jgi:hypothetical protein